MSFLGLVVQQPAETSGAANAGQALVGLAVIVAGVAVYLVPTIIASRRNHPNTTAIFVLNAIGGLFCIGWFAALIWAFTTPASTAPTVVLAAQSYAVPALAAYPPGWYADPYEPSRDRWWDGRAWTDHVAPGVTALPPPSGPPVTNI